MGSCENSWTGRLVIGLQLLSWCAVGTLLLHRGVASIREDVNRPLNATDQHSYRTETNLSELTNSLVDTSTPTTSNSNQVAVTSVLIDKHNTKPTLEGVSENYIDKHTGNVNSLTDVPNPSVTLITPPTLLDNPTDNLQNEIPKKMSTLQTPSTVHNVRVPPSRRPSHDLKPSGAVMTAIGAIMLVVGPTIVAIKCCESYSHGRRFNKLTANNRALCERDLPPTYEEVEGRAPRYSMLFPETEESSTV